MIVAFTGHRPEKIGGYKLPNPTYTYVYQQIESTLKQLNPDKVISGMALGVDQIAAYIAYKLKIPFIAAIPFEGQEKAWPIKSQQIYSALLRQSIEKKIVCDGGYAANKMQIRNQWMVDNCDKLIAVWDHSSGGTENCIKYAQSINRDIVYIDPRIKESK